jgi:cell division protease FtsH
MLDKALLRPGRFDRQITVNPPDVKGREEILKIHAKDKKFAQNIDLKDIAEDTAGFTGAELSNILNEAAILATVKNHDAINQADLEEAIKKVTVGLQKTTRLISDKDKKLTAYHEAGHAIVGWYLPTVTKVKEISIIPRGMAGGYTMYKSDEDKYYVSKTEMEEKMISLLGGRAAEKLILDDISTGASNDLEVATKIAREMITVYGMSDKLGPISLVVNSPEELRLFGHNIEDEIGSEIKKLIDISYVSAQEILRNNIDKLHQVAQLLLQKETVTEREFQEIFNDENQTII